MRKGFYSSLAADSIRKNKKLYLPYFLTSALMIAIFYILSFISRSEVVANMSGGSSTGIIVGLGSFVIAVFAVLFMFYTNSFLMKRRKKEFGLYNVLGMSKKNISRVLLSESVITFFVSMVPGLAAGIGLSKLSESILLRMVDEASDYSFRVSGRALLLTLVIFGAIMVLLYLNSVRQVVFSNTLDLVKSEHAGEKPPKANWLLGILGILVLAAAYIIALKIEDPMGAITFFFLAVVLVIIGSYLIFIAGSVMICRLLQKNKRFYYKKKNFVSISSMAYRMKRNGAGLASICILLTMVLVMISSSACLFMGKEEAIAAHYPRAICIYASWNGSTEADSELEAAIFGSAEKITADYGVKAENLRAFKEYSTVGTIDGDRILLNVTSDSDYSVINYQDYVEIHIIGIDDYNFMTGKDRSLDEGEALLCASTVKTVNGKLSINGMNINIVERLEDEADGFGRLAANSALNNVFVVVADVEKYSHKLSEAKDTDGSSLLQTNCYYQFDTELDAKGELELRNKLDDELFYGLGDVSTPDPLKLYAYSREAERGEFYGSFGGLFFLGILLSIVFLVAAALIVYYKQLSEGFEDQARFEIMQKVGMTSADIRKSINSQMLLVLMLPIAFAVLHLMFAFPVITKMLMLFQVFNVKVLMLTTLVSVLAAAVFYIIVYLITSNSYFSIVVGSREKEA